MPYFETLLIFRFFSANSHAYLAIQVAWVEVLSFFGIARCRRDKICTSDARHDADYSIWIVPAGRIIYFLGIVWVARRWGGVGSIRDNVFLWHSQKQISLNKIKCKSRLLCFFHVHFVNKKRNYLYDSVESCLYYIFQVCYLNY